LDFHVRIANRSTELIQVCADIADAATLARELRALADAAHEYPGTTRRLLVLHRGALAVDQPGVVVQPAYKWLLTPPSPGG